MSQTFHIGDILSITTDCLVSPGHMDGVYRILQHMTGEPLWTHQLPRAAEECKPALLAQHPDLADVHAPEFADVAEVQRWLAEQVQRYGERREVQPLAPEDHTSIDPISELRMKAPHMEILAIGLNDGIGDAP